MIDLKKISNIKTKKDLKKYKLNEPIFLGNYLFHYFILFDNLKALSLTRFPIYKENSEGLSGFHLAAKVSNENKSLKILKYLLKNYSEYSNNTNKSNLSFLNLLEINDNIISLFKEFKNINWLRLLTNTYLINNSIKLCELNQIYMYGSYKLLLYIIDNFKIDYSELKSDPVFIDLMYNTKLNSDQMINIIKKNKIFLEITDNNGIGIIYFAIKTGNKKILEYLIKKNIELDKYNPIYTSHPFITAYNIDANENEKFEMSKLIWKNIKDSHNFEFTNKYGENIAFNIMINRLENNSGDFNFEMEILKKNTIWNNINVDKNTILNILIQLPFKYHKALKNVKIDVKQKNKDGKTILDLAKDKWLTFLKKLPKVKEEKEDIRIDKYEYTHANNFQATFLDCALYFIHLDEKYKNLYIPKFIDKVEENMFWGNGYTFADDKLENYNNYPWLIHWKDKYNYDIHPNLNQLINSAKNSGKYDCAIVLLSLTIHTGGLHAEMFFYDFNNNIIERFDPFGNSYDIESNLDDILEEELTWNTGFTYLNVKNYLPVSGLQNISDELNLYNQKPGDFGGYCLAWCLWYVETRIKNSKHSAKKLVEKSIKILLKSNDNLIEYIRNYANNINKKRFDLLEKAGIPKNKTSNEKLNDKEYNKIYNFIFKKLIL